MKKTTMLRELLEGEKSILIPGAYDALSAKIIDSLGFDAIYVTGFGIAATNGFPDVGLTTLTEVMESCRKIVDATSRPVIADMDTGYGGFVNLARTVKDAESIGVAAIQLEDQQFPKKCGSMKGKQVVPIEEMVNKIKLAIDTRKDKDFLILARTDAIDIEGIDRTIERGLAYAEAGADAIMTMGLHTLDQMKQFCEKIPKPTISINAETETWVRNNPIWTLEQLENVGYKWVLSPTASLYSAAMAIKTTMIELKEKHTTDHLLNNMMHFKELTNLLGLSEVYEMEKEYAHTYVVNK